MPQGTNEIGGAPSPDPVARIRRDIRRIKNAERCFQLPATGQARIVLFGSRMTGRATRRMEHVLAPFDQHGLTLCVARGRSEQQHTGGDDARGAVADRRAHQFVQNGLG